MRGFFKFSASGQYGSSNFGSSEQVAINFFGVNNLATMPFNQGLSGNGNLGAKQWSLQVFKKKLHFSFPMETNSIFQCHPLSSIICKDCRGPYSSIEIPPLPHINPGVKRVTKLLRPLSNSQVIRRFTMVHVHATWSSTPNVEVSLLVTSHLNGYPKLWRHQWCSNVL